MEIMHKNKEIVAENLPVVQELKKKEEPKKEAPAPKRRKRLVAPAIKKKEREVKYDIDGHPYVTIRAVRGRGKNRKEQDINVHPSLIDAKQKAIDSELVRGKFVFHERRNGVLKLLWSLPYLNEHPKEYTLKDGEITKIPRALKDHLQNSGQYPIHRHMKDENGKPSIRIGEYVNRYDFFEMGSIIEKDPVKRIVTVESI